MKTRLSFVSGVPGLSTRRPSAKPSALDLEADASPAPEPLASPNGEAPPGPESLGGRPSDLSPMSLGGPGSPNSSSSLAKTRSKSVLDIGGKKKLDEPTLLGAPAAAAAAAAPAEELANVFPTSIREGFLKKKGVVNIAWKTRYLVLLPHQLAYYDDQPKTPDAQPKGYINLSVIVKVEHHAPESSTKDFTFDITTPTRVYRLQADSASNMDAWIASISGTAANEQQVLASRKRNVSHAAVRNLTEDDRLKADISLRISHQDAELRNWANWNAFEVAAWLTTFGMARYSPTFYEAGITGERLKLLNADALAKTCGVTDKGDATKILANMKKLMQEGPKR